MAALQASDKCSHTHVCCAFSVGLRLAIEPDLRFLKQLLVIEVSHRFTKHDLYK
jgi:hypothetical protein